MFEKQKQETGDGGTSLQAGKDITIVKNVGLQFSEVKEIFHLLLNENFPKLREIASQTATQNIEKYLEKFETKFAQNFNRIDVEKITDPDVQFSFNEVVEANARKGDNVDADVLSELLIERISKKSNNFISIVSSEAIKIVPKLTAEHISFLSLVHYLSSITHTGLTDLRQLEQPASLIISLTSNSFDLSLSNKQYLQFTGALTSLNIVSNDFRDITKRRYEFLKDIPNDELEKLIEQNAPSYKKLMDVYKTNEIFQITLTTVGQMIALANLKRVLGNLDYGIWIK
ncbi:hypothetical protein SAMN04489722_1242 [Algibacter lectus]|uniref:LPO_1073/Vpar_1526 family protein n=1 Tax=Algibacter lectus TaxID=221126 RepID=UPI0008E3094F|nr:LPO_1073/Vpar_1526 family protein [Algibacter lectus]SFD74025.1 hypothetical protein SAMN04489722_1242 [Algibacter lectus]